MNARFGFLLLWVLRVSVWAQAVTATLLGTVTDSSGAVVPSAAITVTETSTNVPRKAASNEEGIYTIPYLPPGTYRIEAEASGFKRISRDNVELRATMATRVDLQLEPGRSARGLRYGQKPLCCRRTVPKYPGAFLPNR